MIRPRRSIFQALLWVAALAALVFLWLREQHSRPVGTASALPQGWVQLENCRLVEDRNNDGDSFSLAHEGGTNTFRLYFVDCPEKEWRRDNARRIADQARYFGFDSPDQAPLVGQAAREFALQRLQQPCTVLTRWEKVYESRRFYAQVLVQTPDGSRRDLAELLVESGLCRLHTKGADLPNGISAVNFQRHLRKIEHAAREARAGAWKR
ncbi:MAG: thermonuclease family protein [Verrucomicrobiales bacterium]|nr:thermonuclease family protein [Verrucomicrobiales bacterium]